MSHVFSRCFLEPQGPGLKIGQFVIMGMCGFFCFLFLFIYLFLSVLGLRFCEGFL